MTEERKPTDGEILEQLGASLVVRCDVGNVKNKAIHERTTCTNAADVVARMHQCGNPDGAVVLLCADCLATMQTQFERALRHVKDQGGLVACPQHGCHKILTRSEDFVYATEALK